MSHRCQATDDRWPTGRPESFRSDHPGESSIPTHARKSAQHARHASAKTPITGGVAELSSVEAAAWILAVEVDATTPSFCDQPTENSGALSSARSTQVVEENLWGTLRVLLEPWRLREEEKEEWKERRRKKRNQLPTFTG